MIRIESLVKKFPHRGADKKLVWKTAVDQVSFEIHRGEIFGLLGPNGAGTVGHRLRLFEGPTKKTVLVLESYSPHKDGAAFTDKRVDYLEPVQFCYFTRSVAWN